MRATCADGAAASHWFMAPHSSASTWPKVIQRSRSTPHVPHAWEAQVLFDESTGTLLCGDLFTRTGNGAALVHDTDMVSPALEAEDVFHDTCLTPSTAPTMRQLAELEPRTLALMHGPSFAGDCAGALRDLADAYAHRVNLAMSAQAV